jgi:N-ethylmaleimide reductase
VRSWRAVVDAVHRAGAPIFLQLWHVGRVSHPDFHDGELPVAPSPIAAQGLIRTPHGRKPFVAPRALEPASFRASSSSSARARRTRSKPASTGVEIHGANGYLLDQFVEDGTNQRTDGYGGSIANRMRLPLEVTDAVTQVWGPDRVGYRISPNGKANSMSDSNPAALFTALASALSERGLAYLHVRETISGPLAVPEEQRLTGRIRELFRGRLLVNGGYDLDSGTAAVGSGLADAVVYGTLFLANPDLPRRFRERAPLNEPDPATFYDGEEKGYVDYPTLAESLARGGGS